MSKIEYKTRGNSSPQGKPRVFVFFHQEDTIVKNDEKSPFDLVCEDILASQNCAIYYESEWDNPVNEEELSSLLSDVQLFVMIVSTNFLFRNDIQNIRTIYNIASAHHTPILPITVEYGIDKYFAERMNNIQTGAGDVQFLDRTAKDPTKIPYQEQLDKYLNSVLVGDELAQRVRAAFDAYIFMSYRKIDRQYAQELMRLIHNIPFCRDIAIWYDEYLTPGEAWSDAIRDAIGKSSLMTLAVTPSLAEPNYIAAHEYPYAKDLKKDIVPAEVKKTDRALLESLFEDMPEFVDGTDIDAITERLQQLATTSNDKSPEHNFLIGLAYLNAIDVERDTDRALQLIQSAAEANLPEAISKLVDMYNTGEGVLRNYQTAIEWQKKYIYIVEKEGFSLQEIADAFFELGILEKNIGHLSATQEHFMKSKNLYEQIISQSNSYEARYNFAIVCNRLSQVLINVSTLDAKKHNKTCYDIAEQLWAETHTPEALKVIADSLNLFGSIARFEHELSTAQTYFTKSLKIWEQCIKENNDFENRLALAEQYMYFGLVLQAQGNLYRAKEYFIKGYDIYVQMMQEQRMQQVCLCFSTCCTTLGDVAIEEGDYQLAKKYCMESSDICEPIIEESKTIEALMILWGTYDRLGDIAIKENKLLVARDYYKRAIQLVKQFSQEPSVTLHQCFVISCYKLGEIYLQNECLFPIAKSHFMRICDIWEQLDSKSNLTMHIALYLCVFKSYFQLGNMAKIDGDIIAAKNNYTLSLQILEDIAEDPHSIEVQWNITASYCNLGDIAKEEGNLAEAKKYFTKSMEIFEQISTEVPYIEAWQFLSTIYERLGDIAQAEGVLTAAKEYNIKYEKLISQINEYEKSNLRK